MLVALFLGCTAEAPPFKSNVDGHLIYPDGGFVPQQGVIDCEESEPLQAPVITHAPVLSEQALQPIRGRATGADLITATTASGAATPISVTFDGTFCVEVPLAANQENAITLTPISAEGCAGTSTQVVITHRNNLRPPPVAPFAETSSSNVALKKPVDAAWNPDKGGSLDALVDGTTSSMAEFSFFDPDIVGQQCDLGIWIRVDMTSLNTINGVRIHWAADANTACATCYKVMLSSAITPGIPSAENPEWVVVGDREDPICSRVQEITFTPVEARWAALVLYEDAQDAWNSAWLNQREFFKLAEFEVLGRDSDAPPPLVDFDRCP